MSKLLPSATAALSSSIRDDKDQTTLLSDFLRREEKSIKGNNRKTKKKTRQKNESADLSHFLDSILKRSSHDDHDDHDGKEQLDTRDAYGILAFDRKRVEELKRQRRHLRDIRSEIISAISSAFVVNTLNFLEKHLAYFVQHPLEMQRLLAQLPSKKHRHALMHILYTYYYADVLLVMYDNGAKATREKQLHVSKSTTPDLIVFDGDSSTIRQQDETLQERLYESYFAEQEGERERAKRQAARERPVLSVDAAKVSRIYRLVEQHLVTNAKLKNKDSADASQLSRDSLSKSLSNAPREDFVEEDRVTVEYDQRVGRILLQCNSQEVLLIEELIKSREISTR